MESKKIEERDVDDCARVAVAFPDDEDTAPDDDPADSVFVAIRP